MTEFHKNLLDKVISLIATEMASGYGDLYELQDYLWDFNCNDEGLTYPGGVSVSMEDLRGNK
jgi:hypothetical protein